MITSTRTTDRLLAGNWAPLREEITTGDLLVTGRVPAELNGQLLRLGPNSVVPDDPASFHWFLGSGMVHGVQLRDGRASSYRNRFVRDDLVADALGEPALPGPRRGIAGEVANISVVQHAGRLLACAEGGALPVLLDSSLRSLARSDFGGALTGGFSGHPRLDPSTGYLHAVAYDFTRSSMTHVVLDDAGALIRAVEVPRPASPMVHDMALTDTYAVLLDLPVTFSMDLAAQGRALPYQWDPGYGARVGLLPKNGTADQVRWCELPKPVWVFHPVNAHDQADGTVVMDVIAYDLMFHTDPHAPTDSQPVLSRWTCDPHRGTVHVEQLDDTPQEFPTHNEQLTGQSHRYTYTVALSGEEPAGSLLKRDQKTGAVSRYDHGAGRLTLDTIYVPRCPDRPAADEDDGWLLSYVYDATIDRSDVVILPAQAPEDGPIARIHLPQRVPFGFHTTWIPARQQLAERS